MENSKEMVKEVGRNEPCPCNSGKKYKRCHGVDAAPKLSAPAPSAAGGAAMPGMPGMQPGANPFEGMDDTQMQSVMQMTQAIQRLPKGQMQRLQAIMQKAMAGKDVSREAGEFEKTLPLDLQTMMKGFQMPQQWAGDAGAGIAAQAADSPLPDLPAQFSAVPPPGSSTMTPEEARAIVEKAAAEGKISGNQAQELLANAGTDESGSKVSRFFKFGKK